MLCATNEQIEVVTDSANNGMRSRSTGSIGEVSASCLVTSTKPNTSAMHSSAPAKLALSPWPNPLIALTRMPKVSALQIALGASNRTPALGVCGSVRRAIGMATAPIGTFTANSQGHGATDRIPAATVGPTAEAIDPIVALRPKPRPSQRRG